MEKGKVVERSSSYDHHHLVFSHGSWHLERPFRVESIYPEQFHMC